MSVLNDQSKANNTITEDQETRFVDAIAMGDTIKAASEKAGISYSTGRRRNQEPTIQEKVKEIRGQVMDQATARLSGAAGDAVDCLKSLIKSDDEKIKLQAAKHILELSVKFKQVLELEERLASMEDILEQEGLKG